MKDTAPPLFFSAFNFTGIIEQHGRIVLEAKLPIGLIAPYSSLLKHLIRVVGGLKLLEKT